MAIPTLIIAGLLILLGAGGYAYGLSTEGASPTALIPAAFGLVLGICGLLAFKESLRKHVMHLAVLIGLAGMVGALMRPIKKLSAGEELALTVPVMSQFAMALLCLVFVILCVRSFVQARKARSG